MKKILSILCLGLFMSTFAFAQANTDEDAAALGIATGAIKQACYDAQGNIVGSFTVIR